MMVPTLSDFACGGTTSYEVEVDTLVARTHAGEFPFLKVRVAEDPENGALIGLCCTHPRHLLGDPDAAYVALIGVHHTFRGKRDHNGSRFGDVLLEDAVRSVKLRWGNGPTPPIWAMIDPGNTASHALFERHGFVHIPAGAGAYDVRYLPREAP